MRCAPAVHDHHRPPRRHVLLRSVGVVGLLFGLTATTSAVAAPSPSAPPPSAPLSTSASTPAASTDVTGKQATFGIGPANTKKIDGRSYLYYLSSPGGRLTDHVAVANIAAKPVTLNLYTADASNGPDGSFGYLARAAPRRDAGTWIAVAMPGARSTITVAPRSTMILPISVAVPPKATPGDHAAGVVVSLTSKVKGSTGQLVNFEQRVALRTYIRVSGPLRPELRVEKIRASYAGPLNPVDRGTATVTYTVRNSGNVNLGAQQKVDVSGLFGSISTAKPQAEVPLLLPGSSVDVTVRVPNVFPQLRMTARVALTPLKPASDVDPGLPKTVSSSTTFWAVPWAVLVAVLVVLAAVGGLLWWRRHRRGAAPPDEPKQSTRVPVGAY